MTYYDRIAKKWHHVTGYKGGAFKELVLNDRILNRITHLNKRSVLELGAGNGYFMSLLLDRFSGQVPVRVVVTDHSTELLDIAQRCFHLPDFVTYQPLDVRSIFPFQDGAFDLILTTFVFNEITNRALQKAISESRRILRADGQFILTVIHPAFVQSLSKRNQLRRTSKGNLTMPAADGLRTPIVCRSVSLYKSYLEQYGFQHEAEDIFATDKVIRQKPGLKPAKNKPIALLIDARKTT